MTKGLRRTISNAIASAMMALSALPVGAGTLFHRAENQVPVAIVGIDRSRGQTEVRLQVQAALAKVCFATSGPDSPYLLATGRNHRYLGGDNVTACPERRDYAAGDEIVLRFELLEPGSSTFSLVAPQWTFIRVQVD